MYLEILIILITGCFLYFWTTNHYKSYWRKRGIPADKVNSLTSSFLDLLFLRKPILDLTRNLYCSHDGKVFGSFQFINPQLVIRDPDLVKLMTIKDFDHFLNHQNLFVFDSPDDLFSNGLFQLKDSKWKDMRNTLTPAFTGKKMRIMFGLITEIADNACEYLRTLEGIENGVEVDFKDFSTRFTNDAIASTAFGLQINSFRDRNNEFYERSKKTTTFTYIQLLKFLLLAACNPLAKFFDIKVFTAKNNQYYMDLILNTMKYRKEHNIHRPDMINILMEAGGMIESDHPKTHDRKWTDVDLVAQTFLFLFGGFETISTAIVFTAHELAENADVQDKLYEEIRSVIDDLNGEPITYDVLQNMKYLDMVVSETLRKWPPNILTDRICTADIEYNLDDGTHLKIQKGDLISLPIVGYHYDPDFFPDPEKFDPERFSEENKHLIKPFTYFPFGFGPRMCIANRFALMETKTIIFYLVRDFEILRCAKTCSPLRTERSPKIIPVGGSWLKLRLRNSK